MVTGKFEFCYTKSGELWCTSHYSGQEGSSYTRVGEEAERATDGLIQSSKWQQGIWEQNDKWDSELPHLKPKQVKGGNEDLVTEEKTTRK